MDQEFIDLLNVKIHAGREGVEIFFLIDCYECAFEVFFVVVFVLRANFL